MQPSDNTRAIAHSTERLVQLAERANDYGVLHGPQTSWEDLKVSITSYVQQGGRARDLDAGEIGGRATFPSGYDGHLMAPILAIAYSLEGLEALRRGDLDGATECVERGTHWVSSNFLIDAPRSRFSERGRKARNSRTERYSPVKKMAAQLLITEMPAGGWADEGIAINSVSDTLTEHHSREVERCGLKTENLPRLIRRWMKSAPEDFVIPVCRP